MATAPPTTNTSLIIPPENTLGLIEAIVDECGLSSTVTHVVKAVKRAAGIRALREVLTEAFLVDYVMPLQGSKLGFRTDKDSSNGYGVSVVRDCAIECLLQGGHLTGNEFNIIAGNCYFTKEFFERKVGEIEGLTDLKTRAGVPSTGPNGALVPYIATWVMKGKQQSIECLKTKLADGTEFDDRIAVRVNSGMGVDAILGKAKRKIMARVYNQATGSNLYDGDPEEAVATVTPAASSLAALTSKLNNQDSETIANGPTTDVPAEEGPRVTDEESQVTTPPADEANQETDPGEINPATEGAFNEMDLRLEQATTLTAINEIEKWAIAQGLNETQVRGICDTQRNKVREKRGK